MKIALLGDSIRVGAGCVPGYGERVSELLSPDFDVYQPEDNCKYAKYMLRLLFDHYQAMKDCSIVHFNVGHWDVCDLFGDGTFSSDEEYRENVVRIARLLKSRHKAVIFATTTPVRNENPYNKNSNINRFNAIAIEALKKEGIIINDLNSLLVGDIERYICPDLIHLSAEGVEVCATAVADIIRKTAEGL